MVLLSRLFRMLVTVGSLTVIDSRGRQHRFPGRDPGPDLIIRLHDKPVEWAIALNPRLAVGEAYMDGRLTVENGDIYDFLDLDRKSTRLNSSHTDISRMPSSA